MKKFLNTLAALILILWVASCSHKNYMLLDMVPADAEFAAVISPTQIASNAGITVTKDPALQFPEAFTQSLDASAIKDIYAINNFLSGSSVDLDSMALYVVPYQMKPVYVIKLRDKDRFVKKLMENGYEFIRGQFGIKIYYCKTSQQAPVVAVRDNIAVLEDLGYDDIDDLWSCFYKPDGNPMSRTRGQGTFVIGDTSKAENLPETVSQILDNPQPDCLQFLLFTKNLMGLN